MCKSGISPSQVKPSQAELVKKKSNQANLTWDFPHVKQQFYSHTMYNTQTRLGKPMGQPGSTRPDESACSTQTTLVLGVATR